MIKKLRLEAVIFVNEDEMSVDQAKRHIKDSIQEFMGIESINFTDITKILHESD